MAEREAVAMIDARVRDFQLRPRRRADDLQDKAAGAARKQQGEGRFSAASRCRGMQMVHVQLRRRRWRRVWRARGGCTGPAGMDDPRSTQGERATASWASQPTLPFSPPACPPPPKNLPPRPHASFCDA